MAAVTAFVAVPVFQQPLTQRHRFSLKKGNAVPLGLGGASERDAFTQVDPKLVEDGGWWRFR